MVTAVNSHFCSHLANILLLCYLSFLWRGTWASEEMWLLSTVSIFLPSDQWVLVPFLPTLFPSSSTGGTWWLSAAHSQLLAAALLPSLKNPTSSSVWWPWPAHRCCSGCAGGAWTQRPGNWLCHLLSSSLAVSHGLPKHQALGLEDLWAVVGSFLAADVPSHPSYHLLLTLCRKDFGV